MACSTLPTYKHVLPRFKHSLPVLSKSLRRRNRLRARRLIFPIVFTCFVLCNFATNHHPATTTSIRDLPTTTTLHLSEAAVRDFRNTRKDAARTTRLFNDDEHNVRILLDLCRVPPIFVSRLGPEGRKKLLGRLTRNSNGVPLWNAIPKILIIDLQNGLGNRLRALASAMEFAFVTDRVLVVLWVPDAHISARITDLFDKQVLDNLIFMEHNIPWPINQNHIPNSAKDNDRVSPITTKHPAAVSFQFINFMTKDTGVRNRSTFTIPNSRDRHIYVKTAYLVDSEDMKHKLLNVFLQALTPSPRVMTLVNSVESRVGGPHALRSMVGVHLRGRSIVEDNDAVDHECEYSVEGAEITDRWRKMSTPKQFIPEMKRVQREWPNIVKWSVGLEPIPKRSLNHSIVLANSDDNPASVTLVDTSQAPKFFISADSVETYNEIAEHFPKERLVTLPRDCDDRGPECIFYAFADIVLLSRTGAMLASGWSSFSEVALLMRVRRHGMPPDSNEGYHVRKSGYDFGTPSFQDKFSRWLRHFLYRTFRQSIDVRVSQEERLELCRRRRLNGNVR